MGTASAISDYSGQIHTIDAEVTFRPAGERDPGIELYLAHGELIWSISGGSGDCIYSAGPVHLPIDAQPNSDDGSLLVDTNQTPHRYLGAGSVQGEEVDLVSTCGTSTFPAGGPWLYMDALLPVSADESVIEGTAENGLTVFTWHFERHRVRE